MSPTSYRTAPSRDNKNNGGGRGFEPRGPLRPCRFSRPIPSAGLGYSSIIIGKSLLIKLNGGLDGIEPAISCVTGRRVNRYTTRPLKRRKRDSNPREPLSSCRFSRPIPSAGFWVFLQIIWTLQDSNLRPNGYEPLA